MIKIDPRYYQLIVQNGLLLWGIFALDISISITDVLAVFITALLSQYVLTRYFKLAFNPLSAINSSMSILLLLNVANLLWMLLAIVIAISSKFFIRMNNKHIFNPSNIAIVTVILITDSAWVTSGQWGREMWLALVLSGIGLIIVIGYSRMLTTISFLLTYFMLLSLRAAWVGDTVQIPLHQIQSGALLVFAFFMLSDPMTTPNSKIGRFLFGILVAVLGWVLQFIYFIPNACLYALALSSPFVVVINSIFSGNKYYWPQQKLLGKIYASKNN